MNFPSFQSVNFLHFRRHFVHKFCVKFANCLSNAAHNPTDVSRARITVNSSCQNCPNAFNWSKVIHFRWKIQIMFPTEAVQGWGVLRKVRLVLEDAGLLKHFFFTLLLEVFTVFLGVFFFLAMKTKFSSSACKSVANILSQI